MEDSIKLIKDVSRTEKRITEVFAEIMSITQSEFATAGQKDIKPSYKFVIYSFEYNNETKIEYNGVIYYVYRTYQTENDKIELYATERLGER